MSEEKTERRAKDEGSIIRCDACPVLCRIREGKVGACDRYANVGGSLTRVDPLLVTERAETLVPFMDGAEDWGGGLVAQPERFVTGIGSGTTYPDYKPAPFIIASETAGVDMVTVVSEGIFSYCGVKVKIDTDRHVGPEQASVRADGEPIGHVTTAEYGSQMLSLGGVRHFTGGSKREGTVTCSTLLDLCNGKPATLTVDGGAELVVQAGAAPLVDGQYEARMRAGCGSAAMGMFARQWHGHADEVIVVDDQITGVLTEHQAGRFLDMPPSGIRIRGRRSTPGRYFQVARKGRGWAATDIADPLEIIERIDPKKAWPGLRLHMVSTTGEDAAWFELDETLTPRPAPMPEAIEMVVDRIAENCEPALCTVLFMAGAGGSLRAGVTENPVRLTRSIKDALTRVTAGGAPVHVWPGGGITFMVDVTRMPADAFGYVPTPALVAPIEFTLSRAEFATLGGHVDRIVPLEQALGDAEHRAEPWPPGQSLAAAGAHGLMPGRARMAILPDGRRLHLQHGPIDIVAEAFGEAPEVSAAYRQAGTRFATILDDLVAELDLLRRPLGESRPALRGSVARRMLGACWPHRAQFVTPMAAVAGSVADEVLAAMQAGRKLTRAYVNNGGDIAVHLSPGTSVSAGVVNDPDRPGLDDRIVLSADRPARGMATSGWRGRSLSFGIADAVTVLAETAAAADAAATLIGNAVTIDHPAIERAPATSLREESDLGARPVTVAVGPLPAHAKAAALDAGLAEARAMQRAGLIESARLALQGESRTLAPAETGGAAGASVAA